MRRFVFRFTPLLTAAVLAGFAASASAAPFTIDGQTYNVEFVTGTGSNEALLDINTDPAHSFLFGYEFDGSKTGYDLLSDVAAASDNALQVSVQFFGTSPEIETITYTTGGNTYGNPVFLYPVDPPNDGTVWAWPNYFISDGGSAFTSPEDFGADGRTLADGSIDAWVIENGPELPPDYNPPENPADITPVPEPATLAGLSLVALPLLLRRKR